MNVGIYDSNRLKQGKGLYIFMGATSGEDDTLIEKGRYDGNYVDGMRQGYGEMTYPNGDQYTGEWVSNKVADLLPFYCQLY